MQQRGYCVEYAYNLLSAQVLFTIIPAKSQQGLTKILDQIYFDLAYLSLFFEFTITRYKLIFEPNFSGDSRC